MPASVKFEFKDKGLLQDLKKLASEIRTEATKALDPVLDNAVDELKASLRTILTREVRLYSTLPDGTRNLPAGLNIPKTKADLVKFIFDEDLSKADFIQRSLGNKTVNDNTRIFVYDRGRIKNWQTVTDSSTYASQESSFRNRLVGGLVIDAASGNIFKPHPDDIKGIKLECSRDTGQTIDSEKKFEAYKNGPDIQRRKYDAPYTRTAVWTVKQEDAKQLMSGALPLNQLLDKIQEGDYATALEFFTRNNKGGIFSKALEKIEDLKSGRNLSEDLLVKQRISALINNLRIRKSISKYQTKYTLFSNYDSSIQESENNFFELLKREIFLWKVSNEDKLVRALMKAVDKVIAKYNKSAIVE